MWVVGPHCYEKPKVEFISKKKKKKGKKILTKGLRDTNIDVSWVSFVTWHLS